MRGAPVGAPHRRRFLLALTLPSAGAAGLLALHLGWGDPRPRPWPAATGWRTLDAPPPPASTIPLGDGGESLELHWLGHSGFLLEWRGTRLLLDPNLSLRCTVSPRLLEPPPGLRGGAGDLPPVDAAVVSHAHYDHLDLPTLDGVPALRAVVLPAGSEDYVRGLRERGALVVGLAEGESFPVGKLRVTAVPARHNGSRHHPLGSRHRAVGWVIEAGAHAVYYAGDTGYGSHFAAIGERYRPEVAILPIGAFSPAVPIGLYHLSPEQAVRAALDLAGEDRPVPRVVPCHFGTFVLSLDRPATALPRFARAAAAAGVPWSMPELLGVGR